MSPSVRAGSQSTTLSSARLSMFGGIEAPNFMVTGGLEVGLRPPAKRVTVRITVVTVIVVLVMDYLLRFMAVDPAVLHGMLWPIG